MRPPPVLKKDDDPRTSGPSGSALRDPTKEFLSRRTGFEKDAPPRPRPVKERTKKGDEHPSGKRSIISVDGANTPKNLDQGRLAYRRGPRLRRGQNRVMTIAIHHHGQLQRAWTLYPRARKSTWRGDPPTPVPMLGGTSVCRKRRSEVISLRSRTCARKIVLLLRGICSNPEKEESGPSVVMKTTGTPWWQTGPRTRPSLETR